MENPLIYKPKTISNVIVQQKQFLCNNKIRISPTKTRQSLLTRKSLKPFSSSIIPQKKRLPTKEDLLKMTSKIQLIKSKCMYSANQNNKNNINGNSVNSNLNRSQSKKTMKSIWMNNDQLNDSVDMDSQCQQDTTIATKNNMSNNNTDNKNKNDSSIGYLLKSKYNDRPCTIFFNYPKCCGIQRQQAQTDKLIKLQKPNLTYKITGSQYKCIVNSLEFNGFVQCDGASDWNVYFDVSGTNLKILETMKKYQKINHFPGCWNLGRKDYMWKHLNKLRRSFPEDYNFVPLTYLFPSDFQRFQMARENADKNRLWIMKPSNQACGRGIKVINKQTKIKNRKDMQVSQYIHNPHLINNFKYDLRIYILVTSYDPLRIYMFEQGLTRFATYQYNTKVKDIKNRFRHLTNFSVNKHSKNYVKNAKQQKDGQGSKWSLTALKKYYQSIGIDSKKLFQQIKSVIIKTCISSQPAMLDIHSKTQQKRNCGFQLYGFDILIDSNLKPWLIQVNVCPSLSSSSPMDRKIKHMLLTDTLNIIGLEYVSKKSKQLLQKKKQNRLLNREQKKFYSKNINNLQSLTYENALQLLSPQDWLMLFQTQQQYDRRGHWQRIFPLKDNVDKYKKLFQINRYNNNMIWKFIKSEKNFLDRLYIG